MNIQQIYSKTRQALDDYHMISAGDRIAIGLSGGKDSLTLLYALNGLKRFYPISFEIIAITIDLGFENQNFVQLKKICQSLDIPYYLVFSEISNIVFSVRKEDNPCSLCANLRKGALNSKALELSCNKIAYGHHLDDIVDTMMLSLIFEGRFHTMEPMTYLERSGLTVIRPLIYLHESNIKSFIKQYSINVLKNKCPVDGLTKRQYVNELLSNINKETLGVKNRMLTAIKKAQIDGWKEV